jgi:hypothetical protein
MNMRLTAMAGLGALLAGACIAHAEALGAAVLPGAAGVHARSAAQDCVLLCAAREGRLVGVAGTVNPAPTGSERARSS